MPEISVFSGFFLYLWIHFQNKNLQFVSKYQTALSIVKFKGIGIDY